ncbi:hypothetical protein RB653_000620 [Dictyostelium firmibasis]|uniref:VWFA domain-containing protein n=1 Tax=Dictyostelium firmibasis TaxID=79012 RepID=A0AAN7U2Z8_9MYCE
MKISLPLIFILILISLLFKFSNSTISNYTPLIGRDLNCSDDIIRVSLLTMTNQAYAMNIKLETSSEVYNFTFAKYFLNNIVSLPLNDSIVALVHYNNFSNLLKNLTNESQNSLNNTYVFINSLSKFTTLDTTKCQTISNSISQMITKFKNLQNISLSLNNNIKNTNSSTKAVMDNYELASYSLYFINNRLSNIITNLYYFKQNVDDFQNELDYYSIIGDDVDHMSTMTTIMKSLLNYSFMHYNIIVDYNIEKNYSSFNDCGGNGQQACSSLEDAGNKAIFISLNSINNPIIYINITGDINGSKMISIGNLFNYCGTLYIRPNFFNNINIDGSNSTEKPFLIIKEPDDDFENLNFTCLIKRVIIIERLNFINWDQTIINININQETNLTPNNQSKYFQIFMIDSYIISSSSILMVYPKNLNEINYNLKSIQFYFTNSYCKNIKSSNKLFAAGNSTNSYLSPIFLIGGSIIRFFSLENCTILSTPFLFIKSGSLEFVNDITISNNNFSINPFVVLINSKFSTTKIISFINNQFFSFILFYQCQFQPIIKINFLNNFQPKSLYNRELYLNYRFENSITIIKNCAFTIQDYLLFSSNLNNTIENDLYYIENSNLIIQNLEINKLIQANHMVNTINSNITFDNINFQWNGSPIIGSNSTINFTDSITTNNTFCGCPTCNFINISYTCDFDSTPTLTPTLTYTQTVTPTVSETPTTTQTQTPTPTISQTKIPTETTTPIPTKTILQPALTPTNSPILNNTKKNIIITLTIVLGVTSIVSLVIISIYKRYNKKMKFTINTESSITDNDNMFGAGDEKAVSPSFDFVVPCTNEDCGQKEGL